MRSAAADRLIVLTLIGLVVASVWLKSLAQPPATAAPEGKLEGMIAATLTARGFTVSRRRLPLGSIVVDARRGACTLNVRDATGAVGTEAAFAQTARGVGPLAFLFGGGSYASPPVLRMRIDRLRRNALHVIGIDEPARAPLALAASPPCGDDLFGLADMRKPA